MNLKSQIEHAIKNEQTIHIALKSTKEVVIEKTYLTFNGRGYRFLWVDTTPESIRFWNVGINQHIRIDRSILFEDIQSVEVKE